MSKYVSGIHVVYGSEPSNAVTDINGSGNDINKDFGGDYVYLVADFSTDVNQACNRFLVVVQGASDEGHQDLAKGAGGDYRYLLPLANPGDSDKITDVRLLRSWSSIASPPSGYSGMTGDINQGRGKTYLYVVWKTTTVEPSQYISGFSVSYGSLASQEPRGALTDIWNGGDDINKGFGGDYVWIVPNFVTDFKGACTGFQVAYSSDSNSNLQDLAKGAGGDYRYLLPFNDRGNQVKITNMRLLRSGESSSVPSGYLGITQDINKDRKGDYLYVIWQTSEEPHQQEFVADISVFYGTMRSQEPSGAVTDIYGGGDDINQDFGGSYVWLVPSFKSDVNSASTGFSLAVQGHSDEAHQDLAKGAGGDYRYLLPICDAGTRYKITGLRLLRSTEPVSSPPAGYTGMSADINRDRKKDYLYLLYQSVYVHEPTFLSGIDVVYGDYPSQEPQGAVAELSNGGDDINKDFGGSYVWIVPSFTTDARKACTGLDVLIQDSSDSRYKDLAKGAGGQYRYLVPTVSTSNSVKISDIRLLRSSDSISSPPSPYDAISSDLNKDRGGTYLYVVWRKTALPSTAGSNPGTVDIPANASFDMRCISNLDMTHRVRVDIPGMSSIIFSGSGVGTWMQTSSGKTAVSINPASYARKITVKFQHSNDSGRSYSDSAMSTAHVSTKTSAATVTTSFGAECNADASYNDAYFIVTAFLPGFSPSSSSAPASRAKRAANTLQLHAKAYYQKDSSTPEVGGEIYTTFDMDYTTQAAAEYTIPGVVGQTIDRSAKGVASLWEEQGAIWTTVNFRTKLSNFEEQGMQSAELVINASTTYIWWRPTGRITCDWTGTLTGTDYKLTRVTD